MVSGPGRRAQAVGVPAQVVGHQRHPTVVGVLAPPAGRVAAVVVGAPARRQHHEGERRGRWSRRMEGRSHPGPDGFPSGATVPVGDVAAAFVVVFLAELGDKTQLVALTLGGRYPAGRVMLVLGVAIALLQTHLGDPRRAREPGPPRPGHRDRRRVALPRLRGVDVAHGRRRARRRGRDGRAGRPPRRGRRVLPGRAGRQDDADHRRPGRRPRRRAGLDRLVRGDDGRHRPGRPGRPRPDPAGAAPACCAASARVPSPSSASLTLATA